MKYALVSGQREEAKPGMSGSCPQCERPMLAKCGEIKIYHWAHQGKRICDQWWENETEWHRAWKGQFPVDWQEIVHKAEDGEKHIADVKTNKGFVIEFQHSFLNPEERRARNTFYPKLVWVVDGTRRKRDSLQFFELLDELKPISTDPLIRKVYSPFSRIISEWAGSHVPVFFDFGKSADSEEHMLWCLLPNQTLDGWVYVTALSRATFIKLLIGETTTTGQHFVEYLNRVAHLILNYNSQERARMARDQLALQMQSASYGFHARRHFSRYRRRF